MPEELPQVLAFDVFGTVVDWHSSIAREVGELVPGVDGAKFARAWRRGYIPAMQRTQADTGEMPWKNLDVLHREILDSILPDFGLGDMSEADRDHLTHAWHRLDPWPDSVGGLTRLRKQFVITPLSNGNISLLTHMAKNAGLPWDCVLSAEVFGHYKPAPQTYLGVAKVFNLEPRQVMLVAAHHIDLDAAQDCGLQTAYIERPRENGEDRIKDVSPSPRHPLHMKDIGALADHFDQLKQKDSR